MNPATEAGFPAGAWLAVAAILGGLAVAAGAFGAHALEGKLSDHYMNVFQTAVQYQMFHALALLGVALIGLIRPDAAWLVPAAWAFLAGILLFSGSLYALVLSGVKVLGAITPIGGVAFLVGWVCLVVTGLRLGA
ncbi:DUF423 domain-containing protein [Halovibrio salipaludis]|uniref:DUF423 domain-containing protein n=1 Tax=Halovibrio salipaludis TaxID=2032626 RepID=UPI0018E92784